MSKSRCLSQFLIVTALVCCATSSRAFAGEVVKLFNGKDLSGWRTFVDPGKPDVSPEEIWSIRDGVIICRGHVVGYLRTEKEYSNYVLRVQWRWGKSARRGSNSGVFVHVVGPDQIWPKGIEAQLASGSAGDIWLVGGAKLTVDPTRQDPNIARHYFRMKVDGPVEKPIGEWNQYEITCRGDTVELKINGKLVNVGTHSELTRGNILLQSEGAEIHFRNIELEPLD